MRPRPRFVWRAVCSALLCGLLMSCGGEAGEQQAATTPTPPLMAYDNAIASAEAGGDATARALAYYERGNAQLDLGEHTVAVEDYTRSLELDPTNARAYNNRALALAALGQADQALADYAAAIRTDPNYTRAYQNRILLLQERADLRGVAADYERLAALDTKNAADYRYQQGSALHELRDFVAARQAYDAALAIDAEHVDALYERALLSFAEGQPTAALADLDRVIQLSPRAANAYYARGLTHAALADHAAAIDDFTAALERQAEYPEALLARAGEYQATGRAEEARKDLATLDTLEIDDTLKAAADMLRQQLPTP